MGSWSWDPPKDEANRRKHGISLAAGALVLDGDPLTITRPDPHPDGDRWQSIGTAAGVVLLFVVHTDPISSGGAGRLISVRRATKQERKAYENGTFSEG